MKNERKKERKNPQKIEPIREGRDNQLIKQTKPNVLYYYLSTMYFI